MSNEDSAANEAAKGAASVVLPEWLTNEFPEHLPPIVLSYDKEEFWASTDSITTSFPSIEEAYDFASTLRSEYQVEFDSSVDGHGGRLLDRNFLCDAVDGSSRFLGGYKTESFLEDLKEDYFQFITETSLEYSLNPDDFITAWTWLTHHPVFWIKGTKEKSYYWATDSGLDRMSINAWVNEETKQPVVFLEHGPHHEENYTYYYHDIRIFVKATTFEEAIIDMAKKVNDVYGPDGYERSEKVAK